MMTIIKTTEGRRKNRMLDKRMKGILGMGMVCFCLLAGCGEKDASAAADHVKEDSAKTDAAAETEEKETEENVKNEQEPAKAEEEESEMAGYVFESNGVKFTVDMDMSGVLDQLGEPVSSYEQPSCAAQGIAKIYTYPGFEIETYPDGDVDFIACIVLKDDSVATSEGIDLSMTKEDIIAAYGTAYEASETGMIYEKDGTKLCFILDGDDISSIEYDSPVLN